MAIQATATLNGGAIQTGGITAAGGDVVRLRLASPVGVQSVRWEIYDYPPGFATPSGWTLDSSRGVLYSTAIEPSDITLGADDTDNFGKYMVRVAVNDARDYMAPESDATLRASYASKIDESLAISVPHGDTGVVGVGFGELRQFSSKRGVKLATDADLRALLGAVDGAGFFASGRVTALDSNHLYAWEMTGSSSPVSNSGSGGSANLTAGGAGSSNLVYGAVSPLGKCVQSINNATAYFTRDGALSGLTTTLTFEVWILYHYLGGTYTVMGHTRSGASNLAVGISSTGALTASYRATGFTSLTMKSNFALSTGVWHHLALTSDGTTANMYANGELVGTGSGAGSFDMGGTTPKTVLLGDPNNSNQVFNGRVCRFRVSNIARSQTYLRNVYAKAIGASDYASVA